MPRNNLKVSNFVFVTIILISVSTFLISLNKPKSKEIKTTKQLVQFIKDHHNQNHLKSFTFIQETVRYSPQQQPMDTSIWYEAIRYPKEFRIDFGNPEKGNANINRNDSIYVYRGNKLVHSGPEIQEFLILEGGLFHYSVIETIERLQGLGIDMALFTTAIFENKPIYIIGADDTNFDKPQIWMDAEKFYVVRRLSKGKNGELYEARYDDFKNVDGYWIETWIEFLIDGKIIQTERYTNIDVRPNLDDRVFNPDMFGKYYWFEK